MDGFNNYHFKVGTVNCIAISDGTETVTIDNVFKDAPPEQLHRALVESGYPPDESTVYFNCLYLQTDQHRTLVDAGWGNATQRRSGALIEHLQAEGISPAEIDTIIITHGDIDHISGLATTENRLVFQNASYILLKEAWDFWTNPGVVARWPEYLTFFGRKTLPLIQERVKVIEAGVEFWPGFQLILAPGHRPGHTLLSITSAGEHFLHLADVVGHPLLLEHPAWHWYADFQPGQAEKDKLQILDLAVSQKALVFGSHLPFPGIGHIIPLAEGWRWQPLS